MSKHNQTSSTTKNTGQSEIFSSVAKDWWNPKGPMKALHAIHNIRMQYIVEQLSTFHPLWNKEHESNNEVKWKKMNILDYGCGAGLVTEPLARLGASVVGVDSNKEVLDVAKQHAELAGLYIDYKLVSKSFSLATAFKNNQKFDMVLLLEVIEHVADKERQELLLNCSHALKPNGILIVSTINRSLKARFATITLAENVLKIVPKGTHDWKWYVKPNEFSSFIRGAGLLLQFCQAINWSIAKGWHLSQKASPINYFMTAQKTS